MRRERERESLKLKLKFNFSNFSLFLSCDSLVKREFLFHHPTNLSHNSHNQPNHNSNNRKRTISLSLSLSLSFHFPNFPFWISSSNPNSPPTSIPIFSFQSLCFSQKIFNSKFHSLSPNLRSLSLSLWICITLKKNQSEKMEAIEELAQLSDSMRQASALLADEDVDESSSSSSSSSSKRPSSFLNVVVLGNVVCTFPSLSNYI